MKINKDKLHYLFTYVITSAAAFLVGLVFVLTLPSDSLFYQWLLKSFDDTKLIISDYESVLSLSMIVPSFIAEIKYLIFVFLACFTLHRYFIITALNAYRGLVAGVGCSLFLRIVSINVSSGLKCFLSSLLFVVLSLCFVLIVSKFSANSILFSKKIIYPVKLSVLFKRTDTYSHLFELLALCCIDFIITLIKVGNLIFTIS